jgi:hypothetical protein
MGIQVVFFAGSSELFRFPADDASDLPVPGDTVTLGTQSFDVANRDFEYAGSTLVTANVMLDPR